jgi:uncharacterized protein (TIGR00299 family) protein
MSKENILYLECLSGISGDMAAAALLDLGASREKLEKALASLGLEGWSLKLGRVWKNGIEARSFQVRLEEARTPALNHAPGHGHEHKHSHESGHGQGHEAACVHRNLSDILRLIAGGDLSPRAAALAGKIFRVVAEAEAEAHGLPLEEVHFHEVGALDSIVDIVSVAVCLDDLGLERTALSVLAEGRGQVLCRHGLLPVPVPAVVNIARKYALPLSFTANEGEMITPTGAAVAAALRNTERLPERFVIRALGLGAGRKDFAGANILRAMILEPLSEAGGACPEAAQYRARSFAASARAFSRRSSRARMSRALLSR